MERRPFIKKILTTSGGILIGSQISFLFDNQKNTQKKLGIALVGLGNYATTQLAPALQETKDCYLAGIVTGTKEKEQIWIDRYQLKRENIYNYKNFDSIINNDEIDIIYVVLPNSLHAEFTIRAAKAGKHVICEKPMATSVSDCKKMIDACKKADKKLSIGYRLHFEPFNDNMMRLGQNKVYGNMNLKANFSFFVRDTTQWRAKKEFAGGGPLMDLGIYCLQGAIYTFGELPISVSAKNTTKNNSIFTDIEGSLEWKMKFPSGEALCKTSYEEPFVNYLSATTEKGILEISPSFAYGGLKGKTPDGEMKFKNVNQQALQMDAFAQNILNNTETLVPGKMGLRDNYIIEKIYESVQKNGEEVFLTEIPKILDLRSFN